MPLLNIWWRAFRLVTLVALNVVQVSGGHYAVAFVSGGAVSFSWWINAKTAAHSDVAGGQYAYAFGAACGTVVGMWLGQLWR